MEKVPYNYFEFVDNNGAVRRLDITPYHLAPSPKSCADATDQEALETWYEFAESELVDGDDCQIDGIPF